MKLRAGPGSRHDREFQSRSSSLCKMLVVSAYLALRACVSVQRAACSVLGPPHSIEICCRSRFVTSWFDVLVKLWVFHARCQ